MRLWRLLVAACLTLGGCASADHGAHVEILASTLHQAGGGWYAESRSYREALKLVVVPGTRLVVAPISDRSITEGTLLDETLPPSSIFGLNDYQQAQLDADISTKGITALQELHARSTGKDRTEIISAIAAAADRFANDPDQKSRRTMLILSTGFEQSSVMNMADYGLDLDVAGALIIKRLRSRNALPNLRNVHVCFAGTTSGRNNWADPQRFVKIRRFWTAFFDAAGAHVDVYAVSLKGCRIR